MNGTFGILGREDLGRIKPLWEKLNLQHREGARYFGEQYMTFTFEKRCEKFRSVPEEDLRIAIVQAEGVVAGYCIATIEKDTGEIDSLFIEQAYRGCGFGRTLVKDCILWFGQRTCERIVVTVADGNDAAFGFYEKCGFFPLLTYLQMKKEVTI